MSSVKKAGILQLLVVLLLIGGAFLAAHLLVVAYQTPLSESHQERILQVKTVQLTPGRHRVSFDTTGVVEARSEIGIVPEVSGRVVFVHAAFFEGGQFAAGEVLFKIDPRDFELEVARREAEVARAQTVLELEEAESSAALGEWKQIHGKRPAPDLVARKPQMAEAEATLKSARAQLEEAKLRLERTQYKLPFAGRVLTSTIAVGQYVQAGQSYGRVFNQETLEVRSSLQDRELEWLLSTPTPQITLRTAYLGKTQEFKGVLLRSASALDLNTRFARIKFGFEASVVDLLPGVFVEVHIEGLELEGVTLLPANALQEGGVFWEVAPNKTLIRHRAQIVYTNDRYVAIRGPAAPLRVVVGRIVGATEGMQVQEGEEDSVSSKGGRQK